jgi:hypothetical protein
VNLPAVVIVDLHHCPRHRNGITFAPRPALRVAQGHPRRQDKLIRRCPPGLGVSTHSNQDAEVGAAARQAGKAGSVSELVEKLHSEAKVIW